MSIRKQITEFFNTKNSLKTSVICLTIFHLFWKILPPPFWYPTLENGLIIFIGALLIDGCLYTCCFLLIWAFGKIIKQIALSYTSGTHNPCKPPSTITLSCYSISYLLISILSYHLGKTAHPFFFIFNSLPVLAYACVNSIGAIIILIFKLICQALIPKRNRATFNPNFNSCTPLPITETSTSKLNIKKLLSIAAVYLFVLTCSNSLINKGLMIPYFTDNLIDILLSIVMLLCFVLYWRYILLAFALAIKDRFTQKNITSSGLINYLTFSSAYYLLAITVLFPLIGSFCQPTDGEKFGLIFIVNYSLYIILNYIGVLIILLVKAFRKATASYTNK